MLRLFRIQAYTLLQIHHSDIKEKWEIEKVEHGFRIYEGIHSHVAVPQYASRNLIKNFKLQILNFFT